MRLENNCSFLLFQSKYKKRCVHVSNQQDSCLHKDRSLDSGFKPSFSLTLTLTLSHVQFVLFYSQLCRTLQSFPPMKHIHTLPVCVDYSTLFESLISTSFSTQISHQFFSNFLLLLLFLPSSNFVENLYLQNVVL